MTMPIGPQPVVAGMSPYGVQRRPQRGPRGVWTLLVGIPVVALLVLAAGTFLPRPILLSVWAATLSSIAAWQVFEALVLTGLAVLLVVRHRTRARLIVLTLAVLTLVGHGVVLGRQLAVAADAGVDVEYAALFQTSAGDVSPDEKITYTTYEGEPVPLWIWRPVGVDADAPVVFLVHGGGWVAGTAASGVWATHARWLADQGYMVISPDYTLSNQQRHLWDTTEGQIGCALAWTGQHAADYGGDVTRLGLAGDSAGGNLVLEAALKSSVGALPSSCGGEIPAISAVSVLYPSVDPVSIYGNDAARYFADRYIGGGPEQYPDRYAAVAPVDHIVPQAPPILVTIGSSDHLLEPGPTERFVRRLREAGVSSELIEVPYGEHVFDWAPGGVGTQVYRQATLDWFEDNGV